MQQTYDIACRGGLDLVTPAKSIDPGRLLGAKNYEPRDEGGYRRMLGYERYDGRPSPSDAAYWIIQFDNGTGAQVFPGDTITGLTSGATAFVHLVNLASGTWGVDAAGEFILFELTGTFEDNEALQVSATTRAFADGLATQDSAATDALDEQYSRASIEERRNAIGVVPGADAINGVWIYNNEVYAFRDGSSGAVTITASTIDFGAPNVIGDSGSGLGIFTIGDRILVSGSAGNSREWTVDSVAAGALTVSRTDDTFIVTEAAGPSITISKVDEAQIWKSSAAGWTQYDLGEYLDFSGGTAEINEGATITGTPSGATATVVGVGVTSGSWTGGDAAGRIYISGRSGTFTASDTLADDGLVPGAANCDSAATATQLARGGKYEFQNYNFFGTSGTLAMWGANGVNRGFRINDLGFAFVHVTGLTDAQDKPTHLEAHKKQLFYSFGASVQHSSPGFPMVWNAITGAAEIATGDVIVALENQPGDILGIFNRNRTYLLYGDDIDNWDLINYSLERGAIEWSVRDIGFSIYHDDRGIHTLQSTDAYGDLSASSISALIDPFIQETKLNIVDSVRIKAKNQYRVFYSDKSGLCLRIEGNQMEFMPFEWLHRVYSICAEEDGDGNEQVYFGSDDGYVYQAEKGHSFDGQLIEHSLRFAYCHCGSPRQKKRYHKAVVEIDGLDDPGLSYAPDFSYGRSGQPQPFTAASEVAVGGVWGVDLWNQFIWDGSVIGEAEAYIQGQGINISLLIQGSTNWEREHTIEGITYNFTMRGLNR